MKDAELKQRRDALIARRTARQNRPLINGTTVAGCGLKYEVQG